jgi:hypothetical protein
MQLLCALPTTGSYGTIEPEIEGQPGTQVLFKCNRGRYFSTSSSNIKLEQKITLKCDEMKGWQTLDGQPPPQCWKGWFICLTVVNSALTSHDLLCADCSNCNGKEEECENGLCKPLPCPFRRELPDLEAQVIGDKGNYRYFF